MDLRDIERVESELDRFIEHRAREARDAEEVEELWAESERQHRQRRHQENRLAWVEFHLTQAACLERTAACLAAKHRSRAEALLEGEGP